jgi:hypothetical protein
MSPMSMRENTKRVLEATGLLQPVKRVLNPVRSTVANVTHVANEMLYRLPRPYGELVPQAHEWSARTEALAQELAINGIVVLRNFVSGERLARVQSAFAEMVSRIESAPNGPQKLSPPGYLPQTLYLEDENNHEARTICANNPFKHVPEFLSLSTDPLILGVIARYLRRPFYLQQSVASRYLPMEPKDFGSFQWHHDAWGRKVNVMFLFTDVGDRDQYMAYVEGSHRHYHNFDRCRNSRFGEEEVRNLFPGASHMRCTGAAGTVFVFDSNGMHRGNRRTGRHRDTLITSFNAGRYVWTFDVPRTFQEALNGGQLAFLHKASRVVWRDLQ